MHSCPSSVQPIRSHEASSGGKVPALFCPSRRTFWSDVFHSCSLRLRESAVSVPGMNGGIAVSLDGHYADALAWRVLCWAVQVTEEVGLFVIY